MHDQREGATQAERKDAPRDGRSRNECDATKRETGLLGTEKMPDVGEWFVVNGRVCFSRAVSRKVQGWCD